MLLSLLWSLLLPLCASRACGCRRSFARAQRSPCGCGCGACGVLRLAARSRPALAPTHSSVARPVATLRFALRRAPCGGCPCRRVPRALPVRCPRCARRSVRSAVALRAPPSRPRASLALSNLPCRGYVWRGSVVSSPLGVPFPFHSAFGVGYFAALGRL